MPKQSREILCRVAGLGVRAPVTDDVRIVGVDRDRQDDTSSLASTTPPVWFPWTSSDRTAAGSWRRGPSAEVLRLAVGLASGTELTDHDYALLEYASLPIGRRPPRADCAGAYS